LPVARVQKQMMLCRPEGEVPKCAPRPTWGRPAKLQDVPLEAWWVPWVCEHSSHWVVSPVDGNPDQGRLPWNFWIALPKRRDERMMTTYGHHVEQPMRRRRMSLIPFVPEGTVSFEGAVPSRTPLFGVSWSTARSPRGDEHSPPQAIRERRPCIDMGGLGNVGDDTARVASPSLSIPQNRRAYAWCVHHALESGRGGTSVWKGPSDAK
jgi:hypothetical protein